MEHNASNPHQTEHHLEHLVGDELHVAAEALSDDDYTTSLVPQSKRRSNGKMFLTFVSLQATFPTLFIGYVARSQGLSLAQLALAMGIGAATMIAYCFGSANLGAATGQTHTLLTRTIFGRWGSQLVSLLMVVVGVGFYAFQARFLMEQLGGLLTINSPTLWAFVIALLMMVNTLFGFKGVSNFASYVAAPIALTWGAWALIKILVTGHGHNLLAAPTAAPTATVLVVTGLLVGANTWGNEPDLFRYSKNEKPWNLPTLVGGYVVGAFLFPITGYLYGVLSNTTDFGKSIHYFSSVSLFGLTGLAVVFFAVNAFAGNDGNLYISVNAVQNLIGSVKGWRRPYTVLLCGGAGAILTTVMGHLEKSFFIVAGISAITIPTASTVMVMDRFVVPRLFGLSRPTDKVTPWSKVGQANFAGIGALLVATAVGSYTGGLIPGLDGFGSTTIGYPALQAWALASVLYLAAVAFCSRQANSRILLGYPIEDPAEATTPTAAPSAPGAAGTPVLALDLGNVAEAAAPTVAG
jgi:purine-cytosine permease-like protein